MNPIPTLTPECPFDKIDIHETLARRRQIAAVWSVEDVTGIRPDLSDDQAWEVLQATRQYHDAEIGINWDVLKCHAELLFGAERDVGEE